MADPKSARPETRQVQLQAIALPLAAALCLIAFAVAAWWSWQHSPLPNPLEAQQTVSFWKWLTSPIERNAVQRLQRVRGTLNAAFALRDTRDVWVVGDGGLIMHSTDGGDTWELQSKITWQPSTATPQNPRAPASVAPQTGAKNSARFGFGLITTASAAEAAPGSSLREVAMAEQALARLGYYSGPVDGKQGEAFQNAVRRYQRTTGEKEDGLLTGELIKRLLTDASASRRKAQTPQQALNAAPTFANQSPEQASTAAPTSANQSPKQASTAAPTPANPSPAPASTPSTLQPVVAPVDLRSIAFADHTHGIAVGRSGVALTTQDGGTTWIASPRQIGADVNEVRFIDSTRAVAVADDGIVYTTNDRGTTWRSSKPGSGALLSVDFANTRSGLGIGINGSILGTRDGGDTWGVVLRPASEGVDQGFSTVRYADAQHAAALPILKSAVAVTSDGGQTWNWAKISAPGPLYSLSFADDKRGVAVGSGGTMVRTEDAGKTWTSVPSVTAAQLHFITFADPQRAVAVGTGGTILTSNDGGQSWVAKSLAESNELRSVRFDDKHNGIAVGLEGVVTVTSDGGISWNATPSGSTQDLHEVSFVSGERWVAVGAKGTVIVTTDGGTTWSARKIPASADLYSVRFTPANRGIAVGDHGTALLSVDGGDTWAPITMSSAPHDNAPFRSVRFFDPQQVIISGTGFSFLSHDGGASWLPSQSDVGPDSLATAGNGLAIGTNDTHGILVSPDGGEHWRSASLPTSAALKAVDLGSTTRALAAGINGQILLSTDGGYHWAAKQSGDTANLYSVAFADTRSAVAVGAGRTIMRSADGGESWRPVSYGRYPAPWVYTFLLVAVGSAAAHKRAREKEKSEPLTIADILVSDRPIQQGDPDFFGFTRRASQLSRFLRHERTDLPVTLAITAEWGQGKSSLMNLVSADLKQNGFRPVWFNAWHHEREGNLLASLLRSVREQALPPWWNPRGFLIRVQLLQKRGWVYLVVAAIPVILVITLISYFDNYPDRWQAIGPNLKYILNIERPTLVTERTLAQLAVNDGKSGPIVPKAWLVVLRQFQKTEHRFNNPDELIAALRAQDVARTDPLSSELADTITAAAEHIPPERRVFPELGNVWTGFSAALAAFIASITVVLNGMSTFGLRAPKAKTEDDTEATGTRERYAADFKRLTEAMGKYLVVLIDDLDRCSRKSLLDMFEHINFLASEGRCSIIVAIAYDRVLERLAVTLALEAGRKRENGPEANDVKEADFYLHKLIQLKLAIPQPGTSESLRLFTSNTKVAPTRENAFARTARTIARYALPWIAIAILSALGIWIGGHWVGAVYPRSTLDAFSQQLEILDQPKSPQSTGSVAATPAAPTAAPNGTAPVPAATPAELLPGVSGTFPTRWAATFVAVALLVIATLMILRDPPLQRRLLAFIRARWRGAFTPPVRERDSEAFAAALTIWYPLAAATSPSPRDLKRFLNRLRFEVMSIVAMFSTFQNHESQIVALAALHEYDPALSTENLRAIFARALQPSESWVGKDPGDGLELLNSRLLVLKAADAHVKRFKRGPDNEECAAYSAFIGTPGKSGPS